MKRLLTHVIHEQPYPGLWKAALHYTRSPSDDSIFYHASADNGIDQWNKEQMEDFVAKGRMIQLKNPLDYDGTKRVWIKPNRDIILSSREDPQKDIQLIGHMPLITATHYSKMRTIDPNKYFCDFVCQRDDSEYFYLCAGEYRANVVSDLEHIDGADVETLEHEGKIFPFEEPLELAYDETILFDKNGEPVVAISSGNGVNQTKF